MESLYDVTKSKSWVARIRPFDAALRIASLSVLWWILNPGDVLSWIAGAPAVLVAVALSFRLVPDIRWRWSWSGFGRFLIFFLRHSLEGGIDVARRAFHPMLPLNTGFLDYTLRLPPGAPTIWLMNTLSLLPGTISVSLRDRTLTIHALDTNLPVLKNVEMLEVRVADLFRIDPNSSEDKA